jgi:hypothetical protein
MIDGNLCRFIQQVLIHFLYTWLLLLKHIFFLNFDNFLSFRFNAVFSSTFFQYVNDSKTTY